MCSLSGVSVNVGIDGDEFSMHYIQIDQIIHIVSKYGLGAQMAKFDVEVAYHNILMHPDDCFLLGMRWKGKYYVDLALPFGIQSAPYMYIFYSVANMVE